MSAPSPAPKRFPRYEEPIKYRQVGFSLVPVQIRRLNRWLKVVNRAVADMQLADPYSRRRYTYVPYYGAIGGGITFSFTPTGLGIICTVKEALTGRTLNLSNLDGFEDW